MLLSLQMHQLLCWVAFYFMLLFKIDHVASLCSSCSCVVQQLDVFDAFVEYVTDSGWKRFNSLSAPVIQNAFKSGHRLRRIAVVSTEL